MEFAQAVAGSKLVIVMGHTSCCGKVSAIDNTAAMDMYALQNLLDEIQPSVLATAKNAEMSSNNEEYTNSAITKNAMVTLEDIRKQSPKMASLEREGKIKIVPAVYNMAT